MSTHISTVQVTNFMGLEQLDATIGDGVTLVAGPNGAGKSSFLGAIAWAAAGRAGAQDQPIRIGADEATVRVLTVGDHELEIIRKQVSGKPPTITVKDGGKAVRKPQQLLDDLLGVVAFDPIKFAALPAKDQVTALLGIFPSDVDLDAVDAEHYDLEVKRREVGRDRDRAKGAAESIDAPDEPVEAVDVADIAARLDTARKITARRDGLEAVDVGIMKEIEQLKAKITELGNRSDVINEELDSLAEPEDVEALTAQLAGATAINDRARAYGDRARALAEANEHSAQWDRLDAAMKANREARADAVRALGVPVEGFELGESGITIHGVPLGQVNTAKQIEVGLQIIGSATREIPLLWVSGGSLLDEATLARVDQLAAEMGTQVIIERVAEGDGLQITDGRTA